VWRVGTLHLNSNKRYYQLPIYIAAPSFVSTYCKSGRVCNQDRPPFHPGSDAAPAVSGKLGKLGRQHKLWVCEAAHCFNVANVAHCFNVGAGMWAAGVWGLVRPGPTLQSITSKSRACIRPWVLQEPECIDSSPSFLCSGQCTQAPSLVQRMACLRAADVHGLYSVILHSTGCIQARPSRLSTPCCLMAPGADACLAGVHRAAVILGTIRHVYKTQAL